MKKRQNLLYRILAALMAMLLLASCGQSGKTTTTQEEETEDPNVGKYYLGAADAGGYGLELDEDDVENNYLRLKDDGSLVLQFDDRKYEGSWKVRKDVLTLKIDADSATKDEYQGSIDDGVIDIEIDAYHLIFVKGKSAAKKYAEAHPATDAETTEAPTEEPTEEPTAEAPTEPSSEEPESTEEFYYMDYYVIYWNDTHPEFGEIKSNVFRFPSDHTAAHLYLGANEYIAEWKVDGTTLHLNFTTGESFDAELSTMGESFTIKTDDLDAYFVWTLEFAEKEWKKLYGDSSETPAETKPGGEALEGCTIEKQTVLDRDGIKVTAERIEEHEYYGPGIVFTVENNSDKVVSVNSKAYSVNGAMQYDSFYCKVEPGKSSEEFLELDEEVLQLYSIEKVGYIDLQFYAVDTETYDTVFMEDKPVRIKTSLFGQEDKPQIPEGSGKKYDKDGIQVYFVHTGVNEYGDMFSRLFVVNSTDRSLEFFEDDVTLNDTDVDGYIIDDEVAPGCVLICDLEYEEDSLKEAGITSLDDVTKMSFSLEFSDMDTYDDVAETGRIDIELE